MLCSLVFPDALGAETKEDGHCLAVEACGIDGLSLALQPEYLIHPSEVVGKVADIHTASPCSILGNRSPLRGRS